MIKKIIALFASALAGAAAFAASTVSGPFGWATGTSLSTVGYDMRGGDGGRSVILRSNGRDMRADIIKAVKDYDCIVLDGCQGDFIVSSQMRFDGVRNKTFMGVNGARIRTQFEVTPELRHLLDSVGVRSMSDQGGGGLLSNGAYVAEEREQHVRQAIIDYSGDSGEVYRNAGLFNLTGCENIIFRNLDLVGPGPVDVGGADLLTLSRGTKHIWVDHCGFTDGLDGNFDINSKSDFITVSWCTFRYTGKAYDHKASNLIGSSEDPDTQGIDNLNVTFAYNIWGEGCEVRMPVCRFGTIHVFNNLYDCEGNWAGAINARRDSEVLIEGNYFDKGVVNIFDAEPDAKAWKFRGNIFRERFRPVDNGDVTVPYAYSLVPASRVPGMLRAQAGPTLPLAAPEAAYKFTIHLMGDSTMADKNISGLNPERGWGMVFENFVDREVRVINYAQNGRSTKSFISGGLWDKVLANLNAGDYVFIQFGHNDEKVDKAGVGAPAWGLFQDNLRLFIKTVRGYGATPVLLTPVARRKFVNGVLDEGTHGEWPAAMRAVAAETGVTLIDMEKATIDWIKSAGDLASRPYFMWIDEGVCPAKPSGIRDDTHSTPRGARRNCDIVCDSIRVKLPEIASHLVHCDIVVDKEGRGDFLTVQDAVDAAPDYARNRITTILVKPGTYRERVIVPGSKWCLKIEGFDAANTVITNGYSARTLYPDSAYERGTSGCATLYIDSNFVTLENLTVENSAGEVGQAVALFANGDGLFFHNCRFLGNQDTVYTYGRYGEYGSACRQYYLDCYIEGTTDFIFGPAKCWFENCEIRSRRDSYITAASTFEGQDYGYVFHNCRLTAEPWVSSVYLGRPWRPFAQTVFIGCELGAHIRPEGWHNWDSADKEKTAFYAEYGNCGPGAVTSCRVAWSHLLSDSEAEGYTFDKVMGLAGFGNPWNPLFNKDPDRK